VLLVALTGSVYSVAAFVIVLAVVSFTCSYLMTETLRAGLRGDEPAPSSILRARVKERPVRSGEIRTGEMDAGGGASK
jgi:hypothetical protein